MLCILSCCAADIETWGESHRFQVGQALYVELELSFRDMIFTIIIMREKTKTKDYALPGAKASPLKGHGSIGICIYIYIYICLYILLVHTHIYIYIC